MPQVNLSSGGVRANVQAGQTLPESTVWRYGTTANTVVLCDTGDEADGICITETTEGELLNTEGENYARKETGVFDEVTINSNFTAGGEWMAGSGGVITAYVNSSDNRPLGKFLTSGLAGETGKITFYGK